MGKLTQIDKMGQNGKKYDKNGKKYDKMEKNMIKMGKINIFFTFFFGLKGGNGSLEGLGILGVAFAIIAVGTFCDAFARGVGLREVKRFTGFGGAH